MRKVLNLLVIALMFLLAAPLIGMIFYFFHGSLELFPTDEQQEKVCIVSAACIAILVLADALLFLIHRKIRG